MEVRDAATLQGRCIARRGCTKPRTTEGGGLKALEQVGGVGLRQFDPWQHARIHGPAQLQTELEPPPAAFAL